MLSPRIYMHEKSINERHKQRERERERNISSFSIFYLFYQYRASVGILPLVTNSLDIPEMKEKKKYSYLVM